MSIFRRRPDFPAALVAYGLRIILPAFALVLMMLLNRTPALAESNEATAVQSSFGIEYAVPNGPRNLVAEAPGRIWYTSTDAGGIGFLEVMTDTTTSVIRYRTDFYGFGANSQPYDLVYDSTHSLLWFTLRGIRSLGKINVITREIEVFPLETVGAAPTGISIDKTGRPWIAQNNGRISRFDPATRDFLEFLLPESLAATPRIEDILYQSDRNIWFTMPDANEVVNFDLLRERFFEISTGELGPTAITIDSAGGLWVTAKDSSRIGRYTPTTVSVWFWFDTPTPDSGPAGILLFNDEQNVSQLWFTASKLGSVGRLELVNTFDQIGQDELGPNTPPGSTWGIIRSSDKHIWVADTGRNLLYELTEPYFPRLYFAQIYSNQPTQN